MVLTTININLSTSSTRLSRRF